MICLTFFWYFDIAFCLQYLKILISYINQSTPIIFCRFSDPLIFHCTKIICYCFSGGMYFSFGMFLFVDSESFGSKFTDLLTILSADILWDPQLLLPSCGSLFLKQSWLPLLLTSSSHEKFFGQIYYQKC